MVVMRLLISPGTWSLYALSSAGLRALGLGGWLLETAMGLRGLGLGAPVLVAVGLRGLLALEVPVLVAMGLMGLGLGRRPRGGSRVAGGEARGLETAMRGGCWDGGGGGGVEVVERVKSVAEGLVLVRRRGWMCACAGSTGPSRMDALATVWMLDVDALVGGSFGRWGKENCLPRLGGRLLWPVLGREDGSSGEI